MRRWIDRFSEWWLRRRGWVCFESDEAALAAVPILEYRVQAKGALLQGFYRGEPFEYRAGGVLHFVENMPVEDVEAIADRAFGVGVQGPACSNDADVFPPPAGHFVRVTNEPCEVCGGDHKQRIPTRWPEDAGERIVVEMTNEPPGDVAAHVEHNPPRFVGPAPKEWRR